jgi:hypothetical protein
MKITRVETYRTVVFSIEHDGEEFEIIYREDGDECFIPVWDVRDDGNDELPFGELRTELIQLAYKYLGHDTI